MRYLSYTRPFYSQYTNVKQFDALMEGYAEYYNFNDMISVNDSIHFYDAHHMNKEGVDIFTPKIVDILEKHRARIHNNGVPDPRKADVK
ncbi:hypothetical protein [Flagellimonas marinaquae]